MKWRLLDTGAQDAPHNMALEKVLLASSADGTAPNTLHILEFFPCVLLGYNQSVSEEIEEGYCNQNGIEINRRISGGGCIYMDDGTLGWEIIAKKNAPNIPGNIEDMYRKLCGGVINALSEFGIKADYRPLNDVEVGGRKISGTGGTELSDSFIFHGTVLVDFHADIMVKALKAPLKKLDDKQVADFKMRTVCMRELLGYIPPMADVKERLTDAFAEMLGVKFEAGGLTSGETEALNMELPLFSSEEWIYGRHVRPRKNSFNIFEHKAEGGLIRVSLLLDDSRGYIKSAFITGDFFAYPERGILALESALKNAPIRGDALAKRIGCFFATQDLIIPGAGAEDFISAVIGAAQGGQKIES